MSKVYAFLGVGAALLSSHAGVFYYGWSKRGESEAASNAIAIEKAFNDSAIQWQDKLDKAVRIAETKNKVKIKTVVIEKEVKRYVKERSDNPKCYDSDGLHLINKAIENTEDKDT